ncbi:AfsR/SARP family transcriptional regulator [Deinococcus multiflagellatus]|uniref:AfsR/SARP family transcriptional regulator n=1 Tax=Deinococcus multiflagellatus TaxID=1656887 RepID=UPI001CCCD89F|nr:hypothetical protein [Deinococcus multiflagellatus]MBZ9713060.1 hypothetical protein [Deinococcus multiflagellatus]
MRLTLITDPAAEEALEATRVLTRQYANALLVLARSRPGERATVLGRSLDQGAALPQCTRRAVAAEVERARHWARGGLKTDGFWLDARSMRVHAAGAQVSVWTLRGRLTLGARLGNYQRHLLNTGVVRGGRITRARSGAWYVQVQLAARSGAAEGTPTSVDALERQGLFSEVARRLRGGRLSARQQGQLALALLDTGQTDEAELLLLTALGGERPDARIHLGLSLLAGSRRDPQARLSHAGRGLHEGPDDFTSWWLRCSQARALVELGRAPDARPIMEGVLREVPASELRSRARALYFAQGVCAALDDFAGQDRYGREALRLFDLLGLGGEGLSLRLDLAYRLYFQGRADESFAMIGEVLDMTARLEDPRAGVAHLICAELHLLSEEFAPALTHLEQVHAAQGRHAGDRLDVPARAFAAECLWRLGRLNLPDFERRIEGLHPTQDFDHVVKAFYTGLLAFEGGQRGAARAAFEQVTGGVALLDGFRLRSYAFLAFERWAAGEPLEAASAELLRALNHVGGELALAVDAGRLAALYTACAERGIGGRPVQRLAQRLRPLLSVRTLGGFAASVNGQPVHIRLSKARELLAYLVLHGPASRETLITALWNGEARPELGSYFKQALHALRQALRPFLPAAAADPVPHLGGLYHLSERFAVQGDALALRAAPVHDPEQLQEALHRYGGPFLPEVDTEWAAEMRRELEAQAQALAMALGRSLEADQPLAAARAYLQAAALNPLFESAWEAAALAYERGGAPHLAQHARTQQTLAVQQEMGLWAAEAD